jgi:polysaccharide biosynthesis/export protein
MKKILLSLFLSVQFISTILSQSLNTVNAANSGFKQVLSAATTAMAQQSGQPNLAAASQMQMLGLDPSVVSQYMKSGSADNKSVDPTQADQMQLMQQMLDAIFSVKTQQDILDEKMAILNAQKDSSKQNRESKEIFGHDFFGDDNLALFFKSSDSKAPDSYILDVGDEISIAVWGYADYNNKFKVNEDGFIQIPEFGRIYVKGMTFGAVKSQIGKRLSTFINLANTQYEITLNYSRSIDVNIVGEVFNPGTYKIPAINSVYNAINAANGITAIGSVRDIQIRRDGKIIRNMDIYQFLFNPLSLDNFYLRDGDFIYVNTIQKLVQITGAVRRPFKYELLVSENLSDLVRYAGGFTPGAYLGAIQVTRMNGENTQIIDVNYNDLQSGSFKLNDGDIVNVAAITGGVTNSVTISGMVRFPGQYELKEGYRISDLIKQAGGIKVETYIDRGYIRRKLDDQTEVLQKFNLENILVEENSPDNLLLQRNDVVQIFSKTDLIERFKVSIDGSVLKPVEIEYAEGLTLNDLLFYAGGLKTEAANSKIEISRVVMSDSYSEKERFKPQPILVKNITVGPSLELDEASKAFKLLPMDKVYVRKTYGFQEQMMVTLSGEVKYPGVYPILDKNETVLQVIERAGGLTPYAYIPNAHLIRTDNNQQKNIFELKNAFQDTASRANLILKDADIINIPTVNQMVSIRGAIRYPGLDSATTISGKFIAGKSAKWYVKHYAGGFKKKAMKKSTLVIYPNGKVEHTRSFIGIKNYPTIDNEGATVMVEMKELKPKGPPVPKEPVSLNIIIPSVIAGLTSIASTLTLLLVLTK